MNRALLIASLLLALTAAAEEPPAPAASEALSGNTLYRVITVRAAPGELADWLEHCDAIRAAYETRGDLAPFILRHSQGDHWDLMFIEPWGSFQAYLDEERMAKRMSASEAMALLTHWLDDAPAFREDLFALGPPVEALTRLFAENAFYHVEMFHALPYKKADLLKQRQMENDYLRRTGQRPNTIWVGIGGSDVDVFTLGFHPDHAAFAAGSAMSEEQKNAAAKAAGFEGVDGIAPYLRSLIARHQDTLAVAVD